MFRGIGLVMTFAVVVAAPAFAQDAPAAKGWDQFRVDVSLSDDPAVNASLKTVLQDILRGFDELVPDGPALGRADIEVVLSEKEPLADVSRLPGKYRILLTVKGLFYCQLAYQFAHEMCHVYCNPRVTNWLIESLCEMCSLHFLDVLAKKWEKDPPFPHWKDYAPNFREYREDRIEAALKEMKLEERTGNGKFIREKLAESEDGFRRDLNTVIALELLPIFEKSAEPWAILPSIGGAVEEPPKDPVFDGGTVPDLEKLVELLPEELREYGRAVRDALR